MRDLHTNDPIKIKGNKQVAASLDYSSTQAKGRGEVDSKGYLLEPATRSWPVEALVSGSVGNSRRRKIWEKGLGMRRAAWSMVMV